MGLRKLPAEDRQQHDESCATVFAQRIAHFQGNDPPHVLQQILRLSRTPDELSVILFGMRHVRFRRGDNLLRLRLRNVIVVVELHVERRPALRH